MFHENVLSCVKNYIKLLQSHESFATCAQRHRETRHFEGNVLCLKHKPPFKESTVAGEASDLCGVTRTLNSVVIKTTELSLLEFCIVFLSQLPVALLCHREVPSISVVLTLHGRCSPTRCLLWRAICTTIVMMEMSRNLHFLLSCFSGFKFLLLLAAKFRTWKTDLMSQRCLGNFMNNAYLE